MDVQEGVDGNFVQTVNAATLTQNPSLPAPLQ